MHVWNGCREWCLPCLGRIFKNDHWNERIHEASMCVMMGTWVVSGAYNMHASTVVLCSKNKGTVRTLWQQPSGFHRNMSDGCLCIYTNDTCLYMCDVWVICGAGGTVGDIESINFIEELRQLKQQGEQCQNNSFDSCFSSGIPYRISVCIPLHFFRQ